MAGCVFPLILRCKWLPVYHISFLCCVIKGALEEKMRSPLLSLFSPLAFFHIFLVSTSPNCLFCLSLSLSTSVRRPDTPLPGCESFSDVSSISQQLIPDKLDAGDESVDAGCALSSADPGAAQHLHQSKPRQSIQRGPSELERTTAG